jgi:hypothetical protein
MMTRSKTVAVLFYCSAMLIGAAAGIAIDRNYVHGKVDQMRADRRMSQEEFFAYLGVTPAQRTSWDSIRSARMRADSVLMAPLRDQMKLFEPQRDSMRRATDASIRALLSPEQLKLWDDLQAKQLEERRQRLNDGKR